MGRTVHGMSKTMAYTCWQSMKARCLNPSSTVYAYYGGSGVTVCDRWRDSFTAFVEDVGPRPSTAYSLDRFPNPRGNYEPGNVRWATDVEQGRNKPDYNVVVEFCGERCTVSEWTQRLGWPKERLRDRLRLGWTVEEAFTAPASALKRPSLQIKYSGVNLHRSGRWCAYFGVGKNRKYIGIFATEEDARTARDAAANTIPEPNEAEMS